MTRHFRRQLEGLHDWTIHCLPIEDVGLGTLWSGLLTLSPLLRSSHMHTKESRNFPIQFFLGALRLCSSATDTLQGTLSLCLNIISARYLSAIRHLCKLKMFCLALLKCSTDGSKAVWSDFFSAMLRRESVWQTLITSYMFSCPQCGL